MPRWKIAGISFDHMHMGDNLRMAHEHPDVEIVALCDEKPSRMQAAAQAFGIPSSRLFTDETRLFEETKPDLVLLCPATARHGEWVKRVAPFGAHVIIEKPFAASLAEADAMNEAMRPMGKLLAINWPLAWVPAHVTAKRLIDEGLIGDVIEVHYYDGNRGPLWHVAGKKESTAEEVAREKPHSWFYKKDHGGGSLLDYLGYGTTLGTWFLDGRAPLDVTCVVDGPAGLEVDEHSVTIARYEFGLSKFETRWGTFTDPWTYQPQPRCGFVLAGTEGTISSYDYQPTIRVQTRAHPGGKEVAVDVLKPPYQNPVQYVIHCLETREPVRGPLSPELSRVGQQIVDAAALSARERRTVSLSEV
jgi:glucose-fructose oxidoreductase